jgi:hypothetical protein
MDRANRLSPHFKPNGVRKIRVQIQVGCEPSYKCVGKSLYSVLQDDGVEPFHVEIISSWLVERERVQPAYHGTWLTLTFEGAALSLPTCNGASSGQPL